MSQKDTGDTPSPQLSPRTLPADSPAATTMSVHGPMRPPSDHPGFKMDEQDRVGELPSLFRRRSSYGRSSTSRQPSPAPPIPRNSLSSILNHEPSQSSNEAVDEDQDSSPRRRKFPRSVQKMPSLPAMGLAPFTSDNAPPLPRLSTSRPILTPKSPMQRSISHMNLRASAPQQQPGVGDVPPMPSRRDTLQSLQYPTAAPTPTIPPTQYYSIAAPTSQRPSVSTASRLEQQFRGRLDSAESSPTMSRSSARSHQELSPPMTAPHIASGLGIAGQPAQPQSTIYSTSSSQSGYPPPPFYMTAQQQQQQQSQRAQQQQALEGPSGTSNRSQYHVMSVQTSSGVVQLPVDVDMASKIANDKRRRNAGASARFRSRRKQREQVAQERIHILEQHTQDLREAVQFYKAERDYFRDVLRAQCKEGSEKIFERNPSPDRYLDEPKAKMGIDPSVAVRGSSHSPGPSEMRSDSRIGSMRPETVSPPRSVPTSTRPSVVGLAGLGGGSDASRDARNVLDARELRDARLRDEVQSMYHHRRHPSEGPGTRYFSPPQTSGQVDQSGRPIYSEPEPYIRDGRPPTSSQQAEQQQQQQIQQGQFGHDRSMSRERFYRESLQHSGSQARLRQQQREQQYRDQRQQEQDQYQHKQYQQQNDQQSRDSYDDEMIDRPASRQQSYHESGSRESFESPTGA